MEVNQSRDNNQNVENLMRLSLKIVKDYEFFFPEFSSNNPNLPKDRTFRGTNVLESSMHRTLHRECRVIP